MNKEGNGDSENKSLPNAAFQNSGAQTPGVGMNPLFMSAEAGGAENSNQGRPPMGSDASGGIFFQAPQVAAGWDAGADQDWDEAGDENAEESRSRGSKQKSGRRRNRRERDRSDSGGKQASAERNDEPGSKRGSDSEDEDGAEIETSRRRRRRRRTASHEEVVAEVEGVKGSTRLEAKRQRRREGRREKRRQVVTESEFLARRESVRREMIIRESDGLNQIAVLEDGLLVEHFVARHTQQTMVGNVYLGRVQNVLPSMEAAFVDLGKGRNAVLYAGEVNWEAAGVTSKPRQIEQALKSGDTVMVQVTKDPIGHKGARLTGQVTLAGRFLVFVPGGGMTGISRKLPDAERSRLKKLLSKIVPKEAGVIVRTAAEGASEEQLRDDVERLSKQWDEIKQKEKRKPKAPTLLRSEPELAVRVVRDVFTEDFESLTVQGERTWETIHQYVSDLSPELVERLRHWKSDDDVFAAHRIDEQLAKGMDRKVFLPSGGSLVIDRTEAMTVIDVNTGKFIGSGGTLEETVTKNNLEAAEEIVRQLRLRDIGGIIVIDFVDMVLESNRELVLRRLVECLGRDRTRHQVTEITSLGLVQMTRKRVGEGLVEAFSTPCECCDGRGFIVHDHPVEISDENEGRNRKRGNKHGKKNREQDKAREQADSKQDQKREEVKSALSAIAAATASAHEQPQENGAANAESIENSTEGAAKKSKKNGRKNRKNSQKAKRSSAKSGGGANSKENESNSGHGQTQGESDSHPADGTARKTDAAGKAPRQEEDRDKLGNGRKESESEKAGKAPRKPRRRGVTMEQSAPEEAPAADAKPTPKIARPVAATVETAEDSPVTRPRKKRHRRVVSTDTGGGE
ncbi:Rne/Rng family ribonuclease [Gleimia hominis]|uniref:Rne/Rng family ribonuclease n=1 Tax=Gleimia hominis TaxID=595468 RepID=UPI0026B30A6E